MNPTISIIIPVYNAGRYLRACMDSLLAQTYRELEIIVVDDGSTDGSGALLEEYAAADARVRCIHQNNAGVSAARNRGLDEATGEWIGFIDSDDWVEPQMCAELMELAQREQVEAVSFGHSVDVPGSAPKACRYSDRHYGRLGNAELMWGIYHGAVFCWDTLYRKELVEGVRYRTDIYRGEDTIFKIEALQHASALYATDKPYYHYVQSEGSAARGKVNARQLTGVDALRWMLDFADAKYPTLHEAGIRGYMNIMVELYYDMQCDGYHDAQREEQILRETKRIYREAMRSREIVGKQKMKFMLFRISPRLFCALADRKRRGGSVR